MKNPAIRAVYLHPNPSRDADLRVTRDAAALLREWGCELYASLPCAAWPDYVTMIRAEDIAGTAQCILTLGGDGTILHMAKTAALAGVPMLGVNLGRLGFLADLESHELSWLEGLTKGAYTLDARMMAQVVLRRDRQTVYSDIALNDAVITGREARIAALTVLADGAVMADYVGDGVIVATPTGSTAYSMSAGGPIVEPAAESLIVTPICAHALYARSFVLGPDRVIQVRSGKQRTVLRVDGGEARPMRPGDRVEVSRAAMRCVLLHLKSGSFYDTLSEKIKK